MRNLTLAAALLMGSTSLVAQTAQPTPAQPMTPQPTTAADAAAAQSIGGGTPAAPSGAATAMPTADPATSATTATETPAADTTVTATAEPSAPAASGATAAPIATASASGATTDALTPLEFAMHVDASNSALTAEAKRERFSRASGNGAIKLLNATAGDFSKADQNRDRKVDATELAAWSGGASMTSGAGTMTPMPSATPNAAEPATGATMTPSDASDAPDGQQADDRMATDIPPSN